MVHRKSEYRLSFKWLPPGICRDLRQSSADYRQQRRIWDYSHHPWGWTVERCDCEEDGGIDDADRYLPLPHNRRKHQMLVEQWHKNDNIRALRSPTTREPIRPAVPDFSFRGGPVSPLPTHRIAWKDNTTMPQTAAGEISKVDLDNGLHSTAMQSFQNLKTIPQPFQNSETVQKPLQSPAPTLHSVEVGYPQRVLDTRPSNTIPTLPSGTHDPRSLEPRFKKMDITPVVPGVRSSRRRIAPSSARKTPNSSKPPPFHSYGWTNAVDVASGQCTRPKSGGVQYPFVNKSLKLRDVSLNRCKDRDSEKQAIQRSRSVMNLMPPVNHSSIWMTEYRRNFSRDMQG